MPNLDTANMLIHPQPVTPGYYWVQVGLINGGFPDVVHVSIDEFDRLTATACGVEREFTEEDLIWAHWSQRLTPPTALLDHLAGIPF